MEILCRDLVKRAEVLLGDGLDSLNRDLTLRSLTKIFCGDLLQTPCADSLIKGSCTAASTENLSGRSCARSSTKNFTKGACRICPGISSFLFTTGVALVLLAASL